MKRNQLMRIRYLSHPQVNIDPDVHVPDWRLSETGEKRVANLLHAPWLQTIKNIFSSAETKAIETAKPIADHLNLQFHIRENMHENDRSATGFLPPDEFEIMADQFFAEPDRNVRGWESSSDAQARIVGEVEDILKHTQIPLDDASSDILIVGHGAVGTLLYCHYAKLPISREYDQAESGNFFTIDMANRKPLHAWQPMEVPPAE